MSLAHPKIAATDEEAAVTAGINYLASDCNTPYNHNGDASRNVLPLVKVEVRICDAEAFSSPPRLDVEGFCRVQHHYDIDGLADSSEAAARYRESLVPFMKALTGADEVVMMPNSLVRRQNSAEREADRNAPAELVHSDVTQLGGEQATKWFYPAPSKPNVRRTAMFNMWKLLSDSPTPRPLALCDARSVAPEDMVAGGSYIRSNDVVLDTAYYHPKDHFRWIYFSKLTSEELLVFVQYDTDLNRPRRVPHTAFEDSSCPPGAAPRVSIESRCIAYWY